MKNIIAFNLCAVLLCASSFAAKEIRLDPQSEYERSIEAVVRNKMYYKSGRFEVAGMAGIMPYDNVNSHYTFGGRLTWHFTDHYGWEVADLQFGFPSFSGYAQDLVKNHGIGNLQTSHVKYLATTNFLLSPFYGKIRVFGSALVYFDTYLVLGGGMANTETKKLSTSGKGVAGTESVVRSGMEPVFDFGLGFKVFLNPSLGLVIDLRDYVVLAETYGNKSFKSNYTVFVGLNWFMPGF